MEPLLAISPWDLSAQQAQATRLKREGSTREQLTEAARGFENVLIRKWIEVARKASIEPKQGAMASYETMADDQLAFLISKQGGVGFVKPMVDQMMAQIGNRVEDPTKPNRAAVTESGNMSIERGLAQ
jgi:Rod binding domain-containing protein